MPLHQPAWIVALTLFLLFLAASALSVSARWVGLPVWGAIALLPIPFLVHFFGEKRSHRLLKDRILVLLPDKSWHLAFFSARTGLTDHIEVIVIQRWHHLFGLSLGLKLQQCPHNKGETLTVVVWRQSVSAAVFHAVALASARQMDWESSQTEGGAV